MHNVRNRFLRMASTSNKGGIRPADVCRLRAGDHVIVKAAYGYIKRVGEEGSWTHEVVEVSCTSKTAELVCVQFDETHGTGDEETFFIDFSLGTIKRTSFACSPV